MRLVDEAGQLSSAGLLEVKAVGGYGSVCGVNTGAANAICRLMGFDGGSPAVGTCANFRGRNVCGSRGMPVAMQQLSCKGTEEDLTECSWQAPDDNCLQHLKDSVVECYAGPTSFDTRNAARLVGADDQLSKNGFGRLEVLLQDGWSPVCKTGFGLGSASVVCRSLGFSAVDVKPVKSCNESAGRCGTKLPQIQLLCDGSEPDISRCPRKVGDEVFCTPEESVLLQCKGPAQPAWRLSPPPPVLAASIPSGPWILTEWQVQQARRRLSDFL